jgi:hypothetical protein
MEYWLIDSDELEYGLASFGTIAGVMFFIVGPVEETSKFLAVRLGVYRTRHLREPLDALVYAGAAASLGFATAENIGYALSFGPEVMIARGPVSTLGHVVFGSLWALSLNPQAQVRGHHDAYSGSSPARSVQSADIQRLGHILDACAGRSRWIHRAANAPQCEESFHVPPA